MKRMVSRIVIAMALAMVSSVMVWAEDKSEKVNFPQDVMVNGTVVKKGNYKVVFNEKDNEVVIYSGKTVIAKTPAQLQERKARATRTELVVVNQNNSKILRTIILDGEEQNIVLSGDTGNNQAVAPQQ